jgi:hypothetical protein
MVPSEILMHIANRYKAKGKTETIKRLLMGLNKETLDIVAFQS